MTQFKECVYVVVNFFSQVIFNFLLLLWMFTLITIHDNKRKIKITREKKFTTTYTRVQCLYELRQYTTVVGPVVEIFHAFG